MTPEDNLRHSQREKMKYKYIEVKITEGIFFQQYEEDLFATFGYGNKG